MSKKILDKTKKIKESADRIEEEVKPKEAMVRGDPEVILVE